MRAPLLLIFAAVLLGGCATSPPRNVDNICEIFDEKRGWHKAAERAEQRWGTPVHVQMAFMRQESAFRARARPPRKRFLGVPLWRVSSAYGYPQAKDETWDWYLKKTGQLWARRSSFKDAADFIAWYGDVTHRTLGIPKSDARRQYLAYHEGHGGYRRQTYASKGWLLKVARRVEQNAERYRQQLAECPRKSWFRRWLTPF